MKTNEVKEIMGIEFTKSIEMLGHCVVWRSGLAYKIDRWASVDYWCNGLRSLHKKTNGLYCDCHPDDVVRILSICDSYDAFLKKEGFIPVAL